MKEGRRMRMGLVAGLLALLALGGAAIAVPPASVNQARPMGGATGGESKQGSTFGSPLILEPGEGLTGGEAPGGAVEKRSGGGSCVTGAGAVLECPKSGGPLCGSGKVASCRCVETAAKSWTAILACSEPTAERPDGSGSRPVKREAAKDPRKLFAAPGCNGGTCSTASGLSLTCPSSGGPSCDGEEVCLCHCEPRSTGGWSTNNACVLVWEL